MVVTRHANLKLTETVQSGISVHEQSILSGGQPGSKRVKRSSKTGSAGAGGVLSDLLRPVTARGWRGFAGAVRRLGLRGSVRASVRVARNAIGARLARRYDRRHGVRTGGLINAEDYASGLHGNHGYLGISARSFRACLDAAPVDLSAYCFVDYGSGKGRALLLAAERPFRRVIGVEFAPDLVAIARRNIADYRNGALACRTIECVQADARQFAPPAGPCLFYFYSPFEPEILEAVLARLKASATDDPRPMLLLYCEDRDGDDAIPDALISAAADWRRLPRQPLPFDLAAPRQIVYALYANAAAAETLDPAALKDG